MSPAVSGDRPLQYFIHDDFDALRMEISGSFIGRAALEAYEAWRRWILMERRQPLVIDISYVTDADEGGKAVLRAWRKHGARIVGSSCSSRAIASPAPDAPVPERVQRRTVLSRLASWLSRPAGNPARAERARTSPAVAKENDAENAGFLMRGETEQQVP